MSMLPSVGPQRMGARNLSPRLEALAELVRIGRVRQGQGSQPEPRAQGQDEGTGFSKSLLDEELLRFGEVISEAGQVDAVAAVRLYQAEYSLEAAR